MKDALLWSFKDKKYSTVKIADECFTYWEDLNKKVPCTNCGKIVVYGSTYTSLRYHNCIGFGYPVCEDCYEQELEEREKYQ